MEQKDLERIKNLLKTYGAVDVEINNFIQDLQEVKDDVKELHHDLFSNLDKLKATKEGKDIIRNAPSMKKEELEKAIANYLNINNGTGN